MIKTNYSQEMFQYLAARGSTSLPWLVRDWNCLTKGNQTTNNFDEKQSKVLSDLFWSFGYSDAFSYLHPALREFTFHRPGVAQNRLCRLYCPPGEEMLEVSRALRSCDQVHHQCVLHSTACTQTHILEAKHLRVEGSTVFGAVFHFLHFTEVGEACTTRACSSYTTTWTWSTTS